MTRNSGGNSGNSNSTAKRPQRHGGALLNGGVRGNRGGSGAPPSIIRMRCRNSFLARIAIAEQIADDDSSTARDRLRALDLLARIGGLDGEPASDQEDRTTELRASGMPAIEAELQASEETGGF